MSATVLRIFQVGNYLCLEHHESHTLSLARNIQRQSDGFNLSIRFEKLPQIFVSHVPSDLAHENFATVICGALALFPQIGIRNLGDKSELATEVFAVDARGSIGLLCGGELNVAEAAVDVE